ncbi:MAG TPA: ATP-binding protein [Bacillus bacterium]|nr:ATP-binding protein [Bacillus sp. (in: firmicutes)]
MKTIKQAIQSAIGFKTPKQLVLDEYMCECGQLVQKTEMELLFGPKAGEMVIVNAGCKCEDIKLAAEAEEAHRRMKKRKMDDFFKQNSLVNKNLQSATFENYIPPNQAFTDAKYKLVEFAETFNPDNYQNLLLVGTYGTGKSHLSYAAVKKVMDLGYSCLFLSVPKLLTKIKETYNRQSKFSEEEILEFILEVDLLVLDDLGAEYTNKRNGDENDNWAQSKLFEVIDSRAGKHTIYTTNLNSADLEEKVNSRNFSRILDNTEIIVMNGPDYRKKKF